MKSHVASRPFGWMPDGTPVEAWTLQNDLLEIQAVSLGAIITSLRAPDHQGQLSDVVLGHDNLAPYLDNRSYLGAVVGRYANRIARGRFQLDGRDYQLGINNGEHHLHGGWRGFDRHVWQADAVSESAAAGVAFTRTSPAGEEHYPGSLDVCVTYTLRGDTLELSYRATTDASTIVNLTQHTYFNLAGDASTILDHEILIHADRFTPVDSSLIPTGIIAPVEGTAFDLRAPAVIRNRIGSDDGQIQLAGGFDHNFVLRRDGRLLPAAELFEPSTGRRVEIATTEPGVQFYTGQLLGDGGGAYGCVFPRYAGLCLETQHFPDSPNKPEFPPVVLRPGDEYRSRTTWRFTTG